MNLKNHTNEELQKKIGKLLEQVTIEPNVRLTSQVGTYRLLDLGKLQYFQNELQKRENKKITNRTFAISIFSLSISICAVGVAYLTYISGDNWENRQIKLLDTLTTAINSQTETLSDKFDSINQNIGEVIETLDYIEREKNK